MLTSYSKTYGGQKFNYTSFMMAIGYLIPLLTSFVAKFFAGEKNFTMLMNRHLM